MTETDTIQSGGNGKKSLVPYFVLMHFGFLMYAFYSVLGKIATKTEFMSARFILLYAAVFLIIFIYAVLWQQVLKVIQLSVASSNKSMTIVWGIFFGRIFFGEAIKLNMIIGAVIIFVGILILNGDTNE